MDGYSTQRKRRSKARERYESRKRHRSSQATQKSASASSPNKSDRLNRLRQERLRGQAALADQVRRIDWARWRGLLGSWLRDGVWYLKRRPVVIRSAVAIVVMVLLIYFASHLLTGRVMPGVETLDIGIGGQSVNAASEMLQTAWAESVMIDLVVDGEVIDSVRPEAIGIQCDAEQTARDARNLGLRAVPFGGNVAPVVSFDFSTAQMYLLDLADDINRRPVNARYEYQDGEIVPIAGAQGHRLDTTSTLDYMGENAANLVERGRLELLMIPLTPDVMQADLYLDEV
ncbi:MAG: peptidoglycan binding domain-containing protein, partial [Chloroflexota bacterium]